MRSDPTVWHFSFHGARDVPEMLIAGRERIYLQAMINARIFDPSAIGPQDVDIYASAYSQPGAMRAGLELYRAFGTDDADNTKALKAKGKLKIPVLAVGGDISTFGPLMGEMMKEVADNVTEVRVPRTGHFVAEENPIGFAKDLVKFVAI